LPDEGRLREAVLYVISTGCQLCPDALEALRELPGNLDPLEVVKKALEASGGKGFLRKEDVEKVIGPSRPPSLLERARRPLRADEIEADIEVLMDPTREISSAGTVEGFLDYFRSRFRKLSSLLRKRMDARDASSISAALGARPNSEVRMLGMVREKKEGDGKLLLVLEDEEATATVVFTPKADRAAYEEALKVMPDQVVCVRAVRLSGDLFVAKEVTGPDVPLLAREKPELEGPIYAVLISDLHFGSKTFLEEPFERFLSWLKGEVGNGALREIARAVKYVVIAGDLVDGIGVYPGQEKELEVLDVCEQYEGVARLLSGLPDHVEVITVPGNHDACRRALPQPAVPKKYAGPLYEDGRFHVLGNPALVSLHGVRFLIYHGNSFDDMASAVPGLGFDQPLEMMKLALRARHLAPIYGLKTPIAPMPDDLLVVEEVPDVFHTGHVHVSAHGTYRGVLLVNSGCWQAQTAYQKARGIKPTPGKAVLVDLSSLRALELDFTKPGLWS